MGRGGVCRGGCGEEWFQCYVNREQIQSFVDHSLLDSDLSPCCRSNIIRLMNEACLLEDTLMRVLVIGLTPELPLSPSDALDIADRLVARAASAHSNGTWCMYRR